MKIKKFLAAIALVLVVVFIGCKKDTFEQIGDAICPEVVFTNPENGATGVPLNQVISVTFNEEMNPATINEQSFIVTGSVVPGKVSYSGKTATFTPTDPLIPNHTYIGRIKTSAKDMMGNAIQTDYIWTFSTGAIISPMVIFTDPADQDTNVVLNKIITASFSAPMDASTVNNSTFTLKQGINSVAGTVYYLGNTAYFKPLSPLMPHTIYTATITTGTKNTIGTPLPYDNVWVFTTGSVTAPIVMSTDPINNAIGVAMNKTITATFSEPMDPLTFTASTFTLKQGINTVAGTVSYTGNTASFVPAANLLPGLLYTATISNGVKNPGGVTLANNYSWTFMTVSLTPITISTDPINNAVGVVLNKIVSATFNVPMDPLTLNAATFTIKQGSTPILGTVSYVGTTASFKSDIAFLPNTIYTATISSGAKNSTGTPLVNDYIWSFTTGTIIAPMVVSTDPLNNAMNTVLNKTISANFNLPMDPASINPGTFMVKQGINPVSGIISYSGTTASFKPSVNLLPGTTYTVTITNAVKNVSGTFMVSDYTWVFSTALPPAPTVISTDAINNATGVPLNKILTANFSTAMDANTLNTGTFTLKQGTTPVSGTVSYSGTTASFKPNANLMSGTTYTATITTGVKNTAGTSLMNNYVWIFSTKAPMGPVSPDMKSVGRFGIIAGTAVSNNAGFSKINNLDVGISPGVRSSITGFPPATIVNGAIYCSDDLLPSGIAAVLVQAKKDLTDAYLFAEGATTPAPNTVSGDQGGKTLAPGIYKSTSTLLIQSGDLTLDAQGDANAVWIFQIASGFTTIGGAGGNVILTGGAQAKNIYWQTGTSATIGDNTIFKGNVLALTSITMNSGAVVTGRMLARNGAVVMTNANTINKP